ncbi:MAG: ester cyclase [Gammaproteobacteria bacterium]|nr:ester cyclase [Gammaproteobacteria bacterium]
MPAPTAVDHGKRVTVRRTLALAVCGACFLAAMSGGASEPHHDNLDVGRSYFEALSGGDWDRVRALAGPGFDFSDPTAAGRETVLTSASDIETLVGYMQAGREAVEAEAVIERAFASGSLVTLIVHYRGRLRGDTPGAGRSFDAYGVAILTVTDGKVTAHVDYIDYETIDRQFGGLAVE